VRRIRQRRDAAGAPTREPEWRATRVALLLAAFGVIVNGSHLLRSFVISAIFAAIGFSHVRGSGSSCEAMVYRDQNQIDTKLRVRDLKGIAIDEQNVPVPGFCVGLFSEPGHRLVSVTTTSDDGTFKFRAAAKGTYRLVAQYDGLGVANSVVIIGTGGRKSLTIRMRPKGIDTTSYFEAADPR
jgi:hypothetical protein